MGSALGGGQAAGGCLLECCHRVCSHACLAHLALALALTPPATRRACASATGRAGTTTPPRSAGRSPSSPTAAASCGPRSTGAQRGTGPALGLDLGWARAAAGGSSGRGQAACGSPAHMPPYLPAAALPLDSYRVLVTKASGQQCWVNLDSEGVPTFLRDYAGGGSVGAIHVAKRESQELTHPAMVRAHEGGRAGAGAGAGRASARLRGLLASCCAAPRAARGAHTSLTCPPPASSLSLVPRSPLYRLLYRSTAPTKSLSSSSRRTSSAWGGAGRPSTSTRAGWTAGAPPTPAPPTACST